MNKRNKLIIERLYEALTHYKAVYQDKAAQADEATTEISTQLTRHQAVENQYKADYKKLEKLLSDRNIAYDKLTILYNQARETIHNFTGEGAILLRDKVKHLEGELKRALQDGDAFQKELIGFRASSLNRLDEICARNAFYSDLLHALTGNRDHETASVVEFVAKRVVDASGTLGVEATESSSTAPGQDCAPFCKCFIQEKCLDDTAQCPAGECRRVDKLAPPVKEEAAKCPDCHRTIGNGFNECFGGHCDLPF